MTVVMGLVTDKFIVFAGDHRRVAVDDPNEFYDDMRKHYRVNKDVIVGFSGDYNVTVECIRYLQTRDNSDSKVEEITEGLRTFLLDVQEEDKDIQQTVFVGGVGKDGKMTLALISEREGFEIEQTTPEPNHFNWRVAYAFESPHDYIQADFDEVVEAGEELTIDRVKEIAARAIRKVSEKDKYVSETVDLDFIAN